MIEQAHSYRGTGSCDGAKKPRGSSCAFGAQLWEQLGWGDGWGLGGGSWDRARGMARGPVHLRRAGDSPAPLRVRRVSTGGLRFPPPRRAQARTCKSGTRDLKAPGAPPGPAPRGVTAAV